MMPLRTTWSVHTNRLYKQSLTLCVIVYMYQRFLVYLGHLLLNMTSIILCVRGSLTHRIVLFVSHYVSSYIINNTLEIITQTSFF